MNNRFNMKSSITAPQTMKPLFAALLAAFAPLVVHAASPAAPDAGSILQQIQPAQPPAASPSGTGLSIEREGAAKLPPSAPFLVNSIQLSGNTLFDTPTLRPLVAGAEGKNLTLSQLGELAASITSYYQNHGYPLARAIIPAQTIAAGIVRIDIIEARYGKIQLDNSSLVNNSLLQATLASLQSGQVIGQDQMDHALLLLSDIAGVVVGATLKPGQAVGTSDFHVITTSAPALWGNVSVDNYGNRYTGRARIGGTVNFSNPLHRGDVLSVSALSSGKDMSYGRIAYDTLIVGASTHVGGSYSALHYVLGEPLAALNAHGTAQVGSLWVKQSLMRSRKVNFYAQLQYDYMQLRDHVDASALRTDRNLSNGTLSLGGDVRDGILAGGVNTASVSWTAGRVGFDDVVAQVSDAATAKTRGSFSKWNASLSRLQGLDAKNALYFAFTGQLADSNLDSSEKMSAGGSASVRAYDVGAVSGDSGYRGSVELQHTLGLTGMGHWQAVAFVDSARVQVNKTPWTAGTNSARLSGAGVGLNWIGAGLWSLKTYVAAPVGAKPVLVSSNNSARLWVEIGKRF